VIIRLIAILERISLPGSVLAQTTTPVNDQIKQLQNEIRNIQRQYQTQIHSLQKQLDDLKAAQRVPKPAPSPPPGAGGSPAGRRAAAASAGRTGCSAAAD
jgi:TolA-binding protein